MSGALATTFLGGTAKTVVGAVAAAAVIGALSWFLTKWFWPKAVALWTRMHGSRTTEGLETVLAYLTHVRDGVMPAVWRANSTPGEAKEQIRRSILEPIRSNILSRPGQTIKVAWFRPDEDEAHLVMYEQVGHTPEGQLAMRLPIGAGLAGAAYTGNETVYCPDCEADTRFQELPRGHRTGSFACVPIRRAGEITGVLSVWATWKDAFWFGDLLYIEALAAAIAGLEVFDEREEAS